MKVYNLKVDTSQPISQVLQIQQNQVGLLSVNVTNDGKYIRNLSCTVYDGNTEIDDSLEGSDSFGFKIDAASDARPVKLVAKSTPIICAAQRYLGGDKRTVTRFE